jgi:hypothetical protein
VKKITLSAPVVLPDKKRPGNFRRISLRCRAGSGFSALLPNLSGGAQGFFALSQSGYDWTEGIVDDLNVQW